MQLLLLSVKPCQKSFALKTTNQFQFLLNIYDMSNATIPKEEHLKGAMLWFRWTEGTLAGCNPSPAAGMLTAW